MARQTGSSAAATAGLLLGAAVALSGCASAVVGAGATAGVSLAQERSIGDAIDDASISTKLSASLLDDSFQLFRDVDHEVVEGRVLLTGKVEKTESRLKAEELAWKIAGVKEVANAIQVTTEGGFQNFARDVRISTELRGKIISDAEINGINYSLETVNGTIYLIGIAQDEAELNRVIRHARNIEGVRKVESYVRLKTDPSRG
ncbi:MAG: BON domain-containing protein [Minwuia sp.]|nr:BON domain-containing protein [Minwuia sp.]